jgi:hypothetical protein
MACRCQRNQCVCSDCPECRATRCRCCADAALAVLPPDDLVHAHDAHVTALAHLELALAALDTLPTDGPWKTIVDSIKNPKEALQKAKQAIASKIPKVVKDKAAAVSKGANILANAAYKDNGKAIAAVRNTSIGKFANRVANSLARPAQAVSRAIKAGKDEKTVAESEHQAQQEHFDRIRQEEKEAKLKQEKEAKRESAAEKAGKNEYLIDAT